ncbi:MAG: endo alpha-1,4 polygalactosaminidase [Hyphomicrobiaceae bacterium]|nr:endo alpha-1,4 polygalactosaminidase [Hyphomicrobiaceae bacterium]
MQHVRTWGYQLQHARPGINIPAGIDMLVVDHSSDGSPKCELSAADVAALKKRPGKPDRLVLAYLSIGEAEDYRFYWNESWITRSIPQPPERPDLPCNTPDPAWTAYMAKLREVKVARTELAPPWLADQNDTWRGNFIVKFWEPSWRAILMGSPDAYLDRIVAAGFDGVYLDRVDVYETWKDTRKTAPREMVALVRHIAAYARAKKPGFAVVPQNAEGLAVHPDYVTVIDAIAKEDLLYGLDGKVNGAPNVLAEVRESSAMLDRVRKAGKKVFAVEYVDDPSKVDVARRTLEKKGYLPLFARRNLDTVPIAKSD